MLKKLIKHEWKNMSKVGGIVLLVILGLTIIGYLFLRFSPLVDLLGSETASVGWGYILVTIFGFSTYMIAYCGATYGIMFYAGFRFYKTMYSGQGYLTHTLPVTPGQLMTGKLLVSGCWLIIAYAAVFLSCILLVIGGMERAGMNLFSFPTLEEIRIGFEQVGFPLGKLLLFYLFSFLISPFAILMQIFGSFTIGQMSGKHKVLMGFLVYIGVLFGNYIITVIAQAILLVKASMLIDVEMSYDYMFASAYASLFSTFLSAIILGIVSYRILKNKLNLN